MDAIFSKFSSSRSLPTRMRRPFYSSPTVWEPTKWSSFRPRANKFISLLSAIPDAAFSLDEQESYDLLSHSRNLIKPGPRGFFILTLLFFSYLPAVPGLKRRSSSLKFVPRIRGAISSETALRKFTGIWYRAAEFFILISRVNTAFNPHLEFINSI